MRRIPTALALPLAVAAVAGAAQLAVAAPALAQGSSHGGDAISSSGRCSAGATWDLKAKVDDGGLEVEFEVDSNKVGQTWAWRLSDDGAVVAKGSARTKGPSGSFTVHRVIANTAGSDVIRFRATSAGKVCTGTVTVPA